jgi:hypothetical protein
MWQTKSLPTFHTARRNTRIEEREAAIVIFEVSQGQRKQNIVVFLTLFLFQDYESLTLVDLAVPSAKGWDI